MSILFIANPVAGKGRAKEIVPIIERICFEKGIDHKIRYTTRPKEAIELAKEAAAFGFERIIAVGGDGTLNEVLNGVAGRSSSLGVIPAGSGNDFVRTIGQSKNIEDVIYQNIFGKIKAVDLGRCNGRYFINVASIGLDAEVVVKAQGAKKFVSGESAYLAAIINTVLTYRGKRTKVKIDDISFEEDTLLMAVANGKFYGGGMLPAPNADFEDGYFDICFVKNIPKLKILYLFPKYIKGQHEDIKEVSFYRGKKVSVTSEEGIAVNIDGETFVNKKVDFEIIEKGINIIVPDKEYSIKNASN
jgi:diacylglycerol kinase (ATP)